MKPTTSILFFLLFSASAFAFSVNEPYLSICPSSTGVLEITHPDAGQYAVALEGDAAKWATLTDEKIFVANKPFVSYLYLTIPTATEQGIYLLKIISTSGQEVKILELDIKVDNCFKVSIVPPTAQELCAGEPHQLNLILRNDGKFKESVRMYTDDKYELGEYSFDLLADEEKVVPFFIPADIEEGQYALPVRVESQISAAKSEVEIPIDLITCHQITYEAPPTFEVCKDRNAFRAIKFKNEGSKHEVLTLEPDIAWITPQHYSTALPEGVEREELYLIEPAVEAGEYEVNFKASTAHQKMDIPVKVIVKDCYLFETVISPKTLQACPGDTKDLQVEVKNYGEFETDFVGVLVDPFDRSVKDYAFKVAAHETKTIDETLEIPKDAKEGDYSIQAGFTNTINSHDTESTLTILPIDTCFGVDMVASPEDIYLLPEQGEVIEVTIKNTGKAPIKYSLSVLGIDWAMIRPEEIAVVPGDEVKAYLYVSPTLQTELGDYEVGVAAVSEDSNALAKATIHVVNQVPATPTGFVIASGDFGINQVGYFLATIGVVLVLALVGLIHFKPAN